MPVTGMPAEATQEGTFDMTQVKCPGCGTVLEDPAAPCPKCHYAKNPEFRKKVLQFVVLFAILGTLWLLFLSKDLWLDSVVP